MPATHRSDDPLLPGFHLSTDYGGLGVLGADIPSTGQHGPALQYPHLSLPAEANDEFRLMMLVEPPLLTFFEWDEDGVVRAEGPVGVHTGQIEGFKNGVSYGVSEFDIEIGFDLSGGATLDGPSAGGTMGTPSDLAGDAGLGGPAAAGGMSGPSAIGGDAGLDGPTAGGTLTGGAPSAISGDAGLDGPGAAGGFGPASDLAGGATLDGSTAGGGLAGPSDLSGGATLDGPAAGGDMGTSSSGGVSGDALLDGLGAGGGLGNAGASGLAGDAPLEGLGASGGLTGPSEIGGDAALDGPAAAGGLVDAGPSAISGDAQLDGLSASGVASGYQKTLIEALYELLNPLAAGGAHYMLNESDPTTRVWPFIVFTRVAHTKNVALRGPSRYQNTRVQIDVHARTIAEGDAVERAIEEAMLGWAVSNVPLNDVDLSDETTRTVRVAKDYSIWSTMT